MCGEKIHEPTRIAQIFDTMCGTAPEGRVRSLAGYIRSHTTDSVEHPDVEPELARADATKERVERVRTSLN